MCPGKIALVAGIDPSLPYARQHFLDRQVYTINPDGSTLVKLTQASDSDESPAWSPDGKSIAFVTYRNGNRLITIMNADGSARREISPPSRQAWGAIVWSPDSKRIIFGVDSGNYRDLYTANADGLGLKRLTNRASEKQTAHSPLHWTEDGKQILFQSMPTDPDSKTSDGWRVFSMNEDGSNLREMLQPESAARFDLMDAAVSHDGQYAATDSFSVYLIDRSAPAKTHVIYNGGNLTNVSQLLWSPDGRKLFIQKTHDENLQGFVIFDRDTRTTQFFNQPDFSPVFSDLQKKLSRTITPTDWAPNGKTILGVLPKALVFLNFKDFHRPEKIREVAINEGIQLRTAIWQPIPCAQ
jgi:Tol biopolymer transport system component